MHARFTPEGIPAWFGPDPVDGSEPLDTTGIEGDLVAFLALHRRVKGKWLPRLSVKPAVPSAGDIAAELEADFLRAVAARDVALRSALADEADPVFFKWQRDECEKEDWLAAVAAVKARFPKPVFSAT